MHSLSRLSKTKNYLKRSAAGRYFLSAIYPAWVGYRILTSARYRSIFKASYLPVNGQRQVSTYTQADRYPDVFSACADFLGRESVSRILSFGCSTGEEVATLGSYMPKSEIVGLDINHWCIHQCKKKYNDPRFSFLVYTETEFEELGTFDAVFAMAVLQRVENRSNGVMTAERYTFDEFTNDVGKLAARVKRGGLLIIDHADFSFGETTVAAAFEPLDVPGSLVSRLRPLFDKQDRKVADGYTLYRIFCKR